MLEWVKSMYSPAAYETPPAVNASTATAWMLAVISVSVGLADKKKVCCEEGPASVI